MHTITTRYIHYTLYTISYMYKQSSVIIPVKVNLKYIKYNIPNNNNANSYPSLLYLPLNNALILAESDKAVQVTFSASGTKFEPSLKIGPICVYV